LAVARRKWHQFASKYATILIKKVDWHGNCYNMAFEACATNRASDPLNARASRAAPCISGRNDKLPELPGVVCTPGSRDDDPIMATCHELAVSQHGLAAIVRTGTRRLPEAMAGPARVTFWPLTGFNRVTLESPAASPPKAWTGADARPNSKKIFCVSGRFRQAVWRAQAQPVRSLCPGSN
jgi:hypothetical protein